uniref:OSJNBa0011K22.2 protein n=2 Tax=Oryza sativa subsp. japonica TaxID=39947 RepID=A0A5S6RAP7_ORYSJ|nr:OSJNBa0011K22.2 [Oryza sativa Japonica Group]CAE05238.1 OSJNBa0011K22.21 [Oryza sativa Japonica Group]CAE75959.1 B1159F04.22 [Oryza sativa Japonica Group]
MGSASADNTMGGDNNCAATVTTMIVKASRGADPLVPISGATLVKERQGVAVEVQDRPPGPATGGSIQGGEGVLRRGGNNFRCNDNDIGLRWRQRQWEWEHGWMALCKKSVFVHGSATCLGKYRFSQTPRGMWAS